MKAKDIIDAYTHIRTIDQTIPDDVLDFMKESALNALKSNTVKEELTEIYRSAQVNNQRLIRLIIDNL